jgi:hypothetical protein
MLCAIIEQKIFAALFPIATAALGRNRCSWQNSSYIKLSRNSDLYNCLLASCKRDEIAEAVSGLFAPPI